MNHFLSLFFWSAPLLYFSNILFLFFKFIVIIIVVVVVVIIIINMIKKTKMMMMMMIIIIGYLQRVEELNSGPSKTNLCSPACQTKFVLVLVEFICNLLCFL